MSGVANRLGQRRPYGLALLLALALSACGRPPQKLEEPPKPKDDVEELSQAAQARKGQPHFTARYNPVRCNCPAFEVQLGSRWARLMLEGEQDPTTPAGKLAEHAKADLELGRLPHYRVRGELSTSPRRCGQGALYLTGSVVADE